MSTSDNMDFDPAWDLEEIDPDFPDSGAHPGVMLEGRETTRKLELGFGGCYNYGPVGPFPVEPAPRSPEAVEQAAQTIERLSPTRYCSACGSHGFNNTPGACGLCDSAFYQHRRGVEGGDTDAVARAAETIAHLRTGSHPESANAKLADLADELAERVRELEGDYGAVSDILERKRQEIFPLKEHIAALEKELEIGAPERHLLRTLLERLMPERAESEGALDTLVRIMDERSELRVCAEAVEILEEVQVGDPIFDDAKAFALAIVEKQRSLEETNRELADALEACRNVINAINKAHLPGSAIPGWDGALSAVLAADAALAKAGRA